MKLLVAAFCTALLVIAIAATSCSINHRSDDFTNCENQSDCPGNQICDNGVCLPPGGTDDDAGPDKDAGRPDASKLCPSQCTSCRLEAKECKVDCGISPATCNSPIVCPEGFNCVVLCSTQNSCRNGIDCAKAKSCDITCSGQAACRNVECGPTPCQTSCTGLQSCRDIHCNDSCACDIDCSNNALCDELECSGIGFECTKPIGTTGCTSEPPSCNTCE